MSLAQNRLHVLANHLQVPGTHVSKISSNDEHLAGEAEGEVRLVLEGDAEKERSIVDGMADVVYDLAVDLGIAFAKLLPVLADALIDPPAFLGGNRSDGRTPDPHDLRLLRPALFSHGPSPGLHSWPAWWVSGACWGAVSSALVPLRCLSLRRPLLNKGRCRC